MVDQPKQGLGVIAALTLSCFAGAASADYLGPFDTLKFDINQAFWRLSGAPTMSEDMTGTISMSYDESLIRLQDIEGRDGGLIGPFQTIGSGGDLASFNFTLELLNGDITGGGVSFSNAAGDTLNGDFDAIGSLFLAPGGYVVAEGLSFDYSITDAGADRMWGDVDLSDFFVGKGAADELSNSAFGDWSAFRFTDGVSSGNADTEFVLTIVPTPASVAMLGLGGLAMTRRRR